MKKAGLIESTRRGFIRVTERGLDVLKRNPERIDVNFLEQLPEFVEFRAFRREGPPLPASQAVETTPEEALEEAYQRLRISIESELLQRVKTASPAFFERLVVKLLVSMGYGGSFRDAGQAVGRSGDGGIDGIIKEDRLGLDVIYIQDAEELTSRIDSKIVLIDGPTLASLMVDSSVGVSALRSYALLKVHPDYFTEE